MNETPNIYQRINNVMKAVDYVKKDTRIDGKYNAVTHDQVVSVCRKHLVDNGIVIYPEQIGESNISSVLSKEGLPTNILRFATVYNINFVNIDNPDDRITARIEAHANDNGDKAPGKAVTYATKTAILKVLCLEVGESDESRNEINNIEQEVESMKSCTDIDSLKTIFASSYKKYDGKKDLQKEIVTEYESCKRNLNNLIQ